MFKGCHHWTTKNPSWQWCSLREALFTTRGLQEAVSVCTVSPHAPSVAELSAAPCCIMDPAEWGSEKHPAFPVWEQAALALPWSHKYSMHSQLRDVTVSMQQGLPVLQRGSALLISVMSTSGWKLQWATKNCHLRQQPWKGGITAEWQICYQILHILSWSWHVKAPSK